MGHFLKNIYKLRFSTGKPSSNGGIVHCHVWAPKDTRTPDAKNTGLFRPLHTATMDSAPAQLSMNPTMCLKGGWLSQPVAKAKVQARGDLETRWRWWNKSSAMPWLKKVDDQSRETSLLDVQTSNDNISIHFSHWLSVEMEAYDSDIKLIEIKLYILWCPAVAGDLLRFNFSFVIALQLAHYMTGLDPNTLHRR